MVEQGGAEALDAIARPDVSLAIWRRTPDPRLAPALAQALAERDIQGETWLDACDGDAAQREQIARMLPDGDDASGAWGDDIADLIRRYAAACGGHRFRVTIETVEGPGCRKFHVDYIGVRLLCTYVGAGTEWLPDAAVRRDKLRVAGNAAIVRSRSAVRRLSPFDVGLFKGEAWPGNAGRGVVHRSPPPGRHVERRLLLSVDADVGEQSRLRPRI